jgi:hypothetical protein
MGRMTLLQRALRRPLLRRLFVVGGFLVCGWLISGAHSAHADAGSPLPVPAAATNAVHDSVGGAVHDVVGGALSGGASGAARDAATHPAPARTSAPAKTPAAAKAQPGKVAAPARQAAPAKAAAPAKTAAPARQAAPAKAAAPAKTAAPAKVASPAKVAAPAKAAVPGKAAVPVTAAKPAVSDAVRRVAGRTGVATLSGAGSGGQVGDVGRGARETVEAARMAVSGDDPVPGDGAVRAAQRLGPVADLTRTTLSGVAGAATTTVGAATGTLQRPLGTLTDPLGTLTAPVQAIIVSLGPVTMPVGGLVEQVTGTAGRLAPQASKVIAPVAPVVGPLVGPAAGGAGATGTAGRGMVTAESAAESSTPFGAPPSGDALSDGASSLSGCRAAESAVAPSACYESNPSADSPTGMRAADLWSPGGLSGFPGGRSEHGRQPDPQGPGAPQFPLFIGTSQAPPTSSNGGAPSEAARYGEPRVADVFLPLRATGPPAVRTIADEPGFSPD